MPTYKIPALRKEWGYFEIEAESQEEAYKKANSEEGDLEWNAHKSEIDIQYEISNNS